MSHNSINCQVKFQTILIKMTLPEIPMRRGNSFPLSSDNENNDLTVRSPPPPYSAPAGSGHKTYDYGVEQQSLKTGQKPDVEINPLPENSSATNKQQNKGFTQGKPTCYIYIHWNINDLPLSFNSTLKRKREGLSTN